MRYYFPDLLKVFENVTSSSSSTPAPTSVNHSESDDDGKVMTKDAHSSESPHRQGSVFWATAFTSIHTTTLSYILTFLFFAKSESFQSNVNCDFQFLAHTDVILASR